VSQDELFTLRKGEEAATVSYETYNTGLHYSRQWLKTIQFIFSHIGI
jgi:hypothetical protein